MASENTDACWFYALNGGTPSYYAVGGQIYDPQGRPTFYICGVDGQPRTIEECRVQGATLHAADGRPTYWLAGGYLYDFATRQPEFYFDDSTDVEILWE
jgi:hypothetical protein